MQEQDLVSPFFSYTACFDPQEVMRRHAAHGLVPRPGHLTNFLGVLIDPAFFPEALRGRAGEVEAIPIPANWHADIAEWGAVLRAVELARERFTVVELGCGWGCWMNNAGVAARRAGLDVRLVGVEGDPGHVEFARLSTATNGFPASRVTLHRAVAAATSGVALFPRQARAGTRWGLRPIMGASAAQRRSATRRGTHDELPMIGLESVLSPHERVDLLHVDIQGGEADLIERCLPTLDGRVAYVVVGTHARRLESRIRTALGKAGWILEIERPAIFRRRLLRMRLQVDGVQGWRNPRLASSSPG
ncbi:MAG: class I SAM-dependent methyltransferase [Planctomycetia bacterium]|nr:class I SAM-dependent methyltransferase [Planctomycetia bacterium]